MDNLNKLNKRGIGNSLILILIMGIILIVIIVGAFVGSLILPLLTKLSGETTAIVQESIANSGEQELQNASVLFEPANQSVQTMEWVAFTLLILIFIGFLVMCYYARGHPALAFVWILVMIVLVFICIFISSSYSDLVAGDGYLNEAYSDWENTNYFMLHLPHIVAVLGIIGGIIMFAVGTREPELDSSSYYGGNLG